MFSLLVNDFMATWAKIKNQTRSVQSEKNTKPPFISINETHPCGLFKLKNKRGFYLFSVFRIAELFPKCKLFFKKKLTHSFPFSWQGKPGVKFTVRWPTCGKPGVKRKSVPGNPHSQEAKIWEAGKMEAKRRMRASSREMGKMKV
jgi:hypothetical protein